MGRVYGCATIGGSSALTMSVCPSCGNTLVRVHRSAIEKWFCARVFECRTCQRRTRRLRISLRVFPSLHSCCVRCGTADVRRVHRRDQVDSMAGHLWSRLQGLTGAPLCACRHCRLQYYDWRPPASPSIRDPAAPVARDER